MWEVIERKAGQTIWRGRDAEGRTCYAVTTRRMARTKAPNCRYVHSIRLAREMVEARLRASRSM